MNAPEDQLTQTAHDALNYGSHNLAEQFGGAWIDGAHNRVHVLLTTNDQNTMRRVSSNVSHPELLQYDRVKFSQKQLTAIRQDIANNLPMFKEQGLNIVAVGDKVDANKVEVTVSSSMSAVEVLAMLHGRYPPDAILVTTGIHAVPADNN